MTGKLAALNRIVAFLAGAVLIAAGLAPAALYWDIPVVSGAVARVDRARLADLPDQPWFFPAAVAALVLLLALGLWLILANIRSRAFDNRAAELAGPRAGSTVVNVKRVGDAACAALASHPLITRAACRVAYVGARPTATFTVVPDPALPLAEVAGLVEAADAQFADALEGVDLHTVYKVEIDRINR